MRIRDPHPLSAFRGSLFGFAACRIHKSARPTHPLILCCLPALLTQWVKRGLSPSLDPKGYAEQHGGSILLAWLAWNVAYCRLTSLKVYDKNPRGRVCQISPTKCTQCCFRVHCELTDPLHLQHMLVQVEALVRIHLSMQDWFS